MKVRMNCWTMKEGKQNTATSPERPPHPVQQAVEHKYFPITL
jgi:hypothetical protein